MKTVARPKASKPPLLPYPDSGSASPLQMKPEELEAFLNEADQVLALTREPGWAVLVRDIQADRAKMADVWPKVNPKRPEFDELRVHALASSRLLLMIEDYRTNRRMILQQMASLEKIKTEIPSDVDQETGLSDEAPGD